MTAYMMNGRQLDAAKKPKATTLEKKTGTFVGKAKPPVAPLGNESFGPQRFGQARLKSRTTRLRPQSTEE